MTMSNDHVTFHSNGFQEEYLNFLRARVLKEHECHRCNVVFASMEALVQHVVLNHRDWRVHPCIVCDSIWLSASDKRNHIEKAHPKLNCTTCSFTTYVQKKMENHVRTKHEKRKYSCDLLPCTFQTDYRSHMSLHKKAVHDKILFPCNYCTHKAHNESHLKTHVQNIHNAEKKKYTCQECDFSTMYYRSFTHHKQRWHASYA